MQSNNFAKPAASISSQRMKFKPESLKAAKTLAQILAQSVSLATQSLHLSCVKASLRVIRSRLVIGP